MVTIQKSQYIGVQHLQAGKNGGSSAGKVSLTEMATSHVHKTAEFWIRADGSTPHLCIFHPSNGTLKTPCTGTPQGYSASSTWSRGQAWARHTFPF
jgi:unsaturated chondroitin disaccharide hydrolase